MNVTSPERPGNQGPNGHEMGNVDPARVAIENSLQSKTSRKRPPFVPPNTNPRARAMPGTVYRDQYRSSLRRSILFRSIFSPGRRHRASGPSDLKRMVRCRLSERLFRS